MVVLAGVLDGMKRSGEIPSDLWHVADGAAALFKESRLFKQQMPKIKRLMEDTALGRLGGNYGANGKVNWSLTLGGPRGEDGWVFPEDTSAHISLTSDDSEDVSQEDDGVLVKLTLAEVEHKRCIAKVKEAEKVVNRLKAETNQAAEKVEYYSNLYACTLEARQVEEAIANQVSVVSSAWHKLVAQEMYENIRAVWFKEFVEGLLVAHIVREDKQTEEN
jgi:hypothetical protein